MNKSAENNQIIRGSSSGMSQLPGPPLFRRAFARDCAVSSTALQSALTSILANRSPNLRAARELVLGIGSDVAMKRPNGRTRGWRLRVKPVQFAFVDLQRGAGRIDDDQLTTTTSAIFLHVIRLITHYINFNVLVCYSVCSSCSAVCLPTFCLSLATTSRSRLCYV